MALYSDFPERPLYVDDFFAGGIDKFMYQNLVLVTLNHVGTLRFILAKTMIIEKLRVTIRDYYDVCPVIWNGGHIVAKGDTYILNKKDIGDVNQVLKNYIDSVGFEYDLNKLMETNMTSIRAMAEAF